VRDCRAPDNSFSSPEAKDSFEMESSNRRILAIIGASLLILGFFMPLLSFLGFVSLSYFDLLTKVSTRFSTGLIILALGGLSLLLALKNNLKPLIWTGALALGVLAFDFFTYKRVLTGMMPGGRVSTGTEPTVQFGPAVEELAGMVIQPSWGLFAMAAGAILLIVVGAVKDKGSMDWDKNPPPPMNYS
jgi:hypothetical protein